MTTRRRLLRILGIGLVSWPLTSTGQSKLKVWRIGFLSARARPGSIASDYYGAFLLRLDELGYVEGRNVVIEWRFAAGDYGRLPQMAAQLVQANVDVIMALGPPAVDAARKATRTIPIVIVVSNDPVEAGFVKSLARPGGNITGLSNLAGDISPKHLELLHAIAPKLARVAVLTNPGNMAHAAMLKSVESAGRRIGVEIFAAQAQTPAEIERVFAFMARERAGAVLVGLDPLFIQQERQIASLSTQNRLPSVFANREYAEAGGLMSYGQNQTDIYRRAATYVDKIFKGAKPADLPVEQPMTFELAVNLKTARLLGIKLPPEIMVQATRVIE